jgi:glycosyltransferase involved in cell wall biosynthesis
MDGVPCPAPAPAPLLTFAIPFYSGIKFLPRALDSILAQTDAGWQALVCDDSPDLGAQVEALCKSYGDPRIRYFRNPCNLGMAGNWNRCLELAETPLVTLLHEDDELEPSYAAIMRQAARQHPDAAALYCAARIIGPDGQPLFSFPDFVKTRFISPLGKAARQGGAVVLSDEDGLASLLRGNHIFCPTLCFRRERISSLRFDPRYKFILDLEFTSALLLAGEKIVGIPEVCYRYRRHPGSATQQATTALSRFREESEYYDRMLQAARSRGFWRCAALAEKKRILKLNLAFVTLKNLLALRLSSGARALRVLLQMQRRVL